jgi:hypothetical protein
MTVLWWLVLGYFIVLVVWFGGFWWAQQSAAQARQREAEAERQRLGAKAADQDAGRVVLNHQTRAPAAPVKSKEAMGLELLNALQALSNRAGSGSE